MSEPAFRSAMEYCRRYFCTLAGVPGERRFVAIFASAGLIVFIAWIDRVSGNDPALSLLYLIPVSIAGWFGGGLAAIGVASAAVGAGFAAGFLSNSNGLSYAALFWISLTRLVVYLAQGIAIASFRRHLEAAKTTAARESKLARTDGLTGLPNTRGFYDLASAALARARETNDSLCVAYLDLDNFKPFNEYLGHSAGDDILVEVAKIVRGVVGDHGIAARVGGDEFVVLLRGKEARRAEEIGAEIATRVRQIGSLYAGLGFGATVGIARFETLPETVIRLVTDADEIMYAGKTSAKGTVLVRELRDAEIDAVSIRSSEVAS